LAVNVEELYKKYGAMVFRRCRSLLKDEERAMDAMQDVFVKLLKRKKDLNDKYPSSLLYTIATNTCLNIIRDEKKVADSVDDEILTRIASWDSVEDKAMDRFFLEEIFSTQKETTKTIAVLHYKDRMTLEETADYVGMSVSGVRKRLRKLREAGLELKGKTDE